jgi:hypothetical protein
VVTVTLSSGGGEEWGLKILPSHVAGQGSPDLTSVKLSEVHGRGDATWTHSMGGDPLFFKEGLRLGQRRLDLGLGSPEW